MEHSPLPWAARKIATGGIVLVSALNQEVAILYQFDPDSEQDIRKANSVLILDAVNRQVIISDREVQEIKDRNLQHRQTRFSYDRDPALAVVFKQSVQQVDKLLKCVEQRDIIIEEILRDKGVLDQAAIPILQVREDNAQMKESLNQIIAAYEDGAPTWGGMIDKMAGLAYKAMRRNPKFGTGTEYTCDEDGVDDEDHTYPDPGEM